MINGVLMLPPVDDLARMGELLSLVPEESRGEAAQEAWEAHQSGGDPYQAVEDFRVSENAPQASPEPVNAKGNDEKTEAPPKPKPGRRKTKVATATPR